MELLPYLNPVDDTHSPCSRLQRNFGQGKSSGLCAWHKHQAGSWWTKSTKSCIQARIGVPEKQKDIYESDMRKERTGQNSQAEEQPCPIDVFMESIFALLTTRYLSKEENVVLDGQPSPSSLLDLPPSSRHHLAMPINIFSKSDDTNCCKAPLALPS